MRKKNYYWKFTKKFGIIFVFQSLLGSLDISSFAYYASFDTQLMYVRSQELCARTRTMEDA